MKQYEKKEYSSVSLNMCREYLGKEVCLVIDQPYGTYYKGTKYELNYGYVPETIAPDGDELDAYYIGINKPLKK